MDTSTSHEVILEKNKKLSSETDVFVAAQKSPAWAVTIWKNFLHNIFLLSVLIFTVPVAASPHNDGFKDTFGGDGSANKSPDSPRFILHPTHAYIIKNKPATLMCRAQFAVKVRFKCNGATSLDSTDHLMDDLPSGTQQVEAVLAVTREQVEEYFGPDGYSCYCAAWNAKGVKSTSFSASVSVAYLRRHFFEPPYSRSVALESQVEMRCLPPDGQPPPSTFWLKNDRPIDFSVEMNYRVSSEGSLLVLSAGRDDVGNYSCVAENVAAKRESEPASLKVYKDGTWSPWSAWSPCSTECGTGYQKRTRTCTAPQPPTGVLPCQEPAFQKKECSTGVPCPAVDGAWSPWSAWSTCGSDCTQQSVRLCNSPAPLFGGRPCVGEDNAVRNCSGGMCMKPNMFGDGFTKKARDEAIRQDITLIVVLAVLVPLVLLLLFFVLRKYAAKNRQDGVLYEAAVSDYPLPFYAGGTTEKKSYVFGPDLTHGINATLNTLASGRIVDRTTYSAAATLPNSEAKSTRSEAHYSTPVPEDAMSVSENAMPPSEHLYDLPLIRSSIDSPSPTEGLHLLPSASNTVTRTNAFGAGPSQNNASPATSLQKSGRSASPLSYISDASGYSHTSTNSDAPDSLDCDSAGVGGAGGGDDTVVWEMVGHSGGRLVVPEYGVTLTVPEGAIPPDTSYKLFIGVLLRLDVSLPLTQHQTLLSPVICCGPSTVKLLKPVIVAFEHSASLQHTAWRIHLYTCQDSPASPEKSWHKLITLGEERVDTPVYTQLDGQQAYLMTENLQQFVLLGEGAGSAAPVKVMRVVASAPPPDLNGRLAVTLHATQDTSAHLKSATALERSRGASLLDKPKKFYLHDNGADLVFSLEEITAGWKLSQDNFIQEIPFDSLWSGGEDCSPWACATFLLERIDGLSTSNRSSTLSCRVMAEQRGASSVSVARVNTDFPYAPVTDSPAHVLLRPSTVSSAAGSPLVTLSGDPRPVRLPGRLRRELCRCLDPPNARGNDWRMLAARLNVDRYLNYFACKNSPTEHILDLWEARHREPSAATDLLNVLRVMGRPDAAHVLESHTGPWI
ncbi:UPA domain [Trinorchestia longiramus]|nr:UPA domain [Trinorchestia longiramus]